MKRRIGHFECSRCHEAFESYSQNPKFCSRKCQHPNQGTVYSCLACGEAFKYRPGDANKCCSRKCGFEYQRRIAADCKQPAVCKIFNLSCNYCNQPFVSQTIRRKYCSYRCERNVFNRSQRTIYVGKSKSQHRCKQCNKSFESAYPAQLHCSEACANVTEKERRKDQAVRRDMRLRGKSPSGERVYRSKIFERDGWTCQLCKKRVDQNSKYPDLMSPTIDHIIPIANGGLHHPNNVQLAHFLCNSRRQNVGPAQLRLQA
jgi:hypothetical protein